MMMSVRSALVVTDGERADQDQPAREQLMNVDTAELDDAVVITVDGQIDGLTAPRLRSVINNAFDRLDGRLLLIDLTDVEFLGSPGLRALTDTAAEAVHHHGREPFRVIVDDVRPVIRPIELAGLDAVLSLYYSVDDALVR
jgi:anti-sigma B factor antagonist